MRIAAAKFYDLQGRIFKILVYVNQNSVSLHQAKKSDTYIHSQGSVQILREQKDASMNLCYKIQTSGTLCSSFDFSAGCRILAEAWMTFTWCFKGRAGRQVSVLGCYTAFSSLQRGALPLGRIGVGSSGKQVLLEENGHVSEYSRYHSVVWLLAPVGK